MAQQLIEAGFPNAHPLYGGLDAWKRAGYPVDSKTPDSKTPDSKTP